MVSGKPENNVLSFLAEIDYHLILQELCPNEQNPRNACAK